jgi:hypothetical protein
MSIALPIIVGTAAGLILAVGIVFLGLDAVARAWQAVTR